MIRIEYHDTSILTGWNKRVKCLSSYIKDIVSKGYIGGRTKELSKGKLLQHYRTLHPFEQDVIDKYLGLSWKSKLKGKIKIPAFIVSEDVHKFFKFLDDNNQKELNNLLYVTPEKLIDKIKEIDTASGGVLASDRTKDASQRSELFHALDAVFVEYGYGQLKDKSQFYTATNVSYCPYCNHGDVSIKKKNGKNHSVGRIDHFYCKELYPILALTLSNLVPLTSSMRHPN